MTVFPNHNLVKEEKKKDEKKDGDKK